MTRFFATFFVLSSLSLAALTTGCAPGGYNPYSLRARTNLDYWNGINTAIRQVNLARSAGSFEQLSAVEIAIDQLQRMPTKSVDRELIDLKTSTVNLMESIRVYLAQAPGAPVPDPTVAPGYLHLDEAKLIEQGMRTRNILASRYRIEFPRTFNRAEEYRRQPEVIGFAPMRDPRISR